VREDVLVERYPYDEFRRDMLAFIDEAVLHTLISHSVSDVFHVEDYETDSRYRRESLH
jgi:hypothetical protein